MGRAFEYRKARKFARWDKMSKAFTRIGKEISMAVKAGGPNPESNPRLRQAILNAKGVSMPKDRVENAIKKASAKDSADYQEVIYEGYAPHGVAVVVETATDNTTRTVANLRHIFSKNGGSLGTSGSVGFLFERKGVFKFSNTGFNQDEFELEMIDHGLDALEIEEETVTVYTKMEDFGAMSRALEERGMAIISQGLQFVPLTSKELTEEQVDEVLDLVDKLEQDDDVQHVFHNLA